MNESRRSKTPFWATLGVVAVLGLIAIAYAANRPKSRPPDVDLKADPAQARGYLLGDSTAPVQVMEFADFECPACQTFATLSEPDIRRKFVDTKQVSFRYYDFPLPMHANTWEASNAAACADEQGKFWQMHDALFENQDTWNGEATSNPKNVLRDLAQGIGVDGAKWEQCYDADRYRARIASNRAEAERRHLRSTPTFIIGNKVYEGALTPDQFAKHVEEARAAAATTPAATPASVTPPTPAGKARP